MEALEILRKHIKGHYLFSNEVSYEQLVEFQKSLISAMEEYTELRLSNVLRQSEHFVCKCRCEHGYNDEFGNELFCSIKENTN